MMVPRMMYGRVLRFFAGAAGASPFSAVWAGSVSEFAVVMQWSPWDPSLVPSGGRSDGARRREDRR